MRKSKPAGLQQLAGIYGIQRTYRALGGKRVTASDEAVLATLSALGVDIERAGMTGALQAARAEQSMHDSVVIAWDGRLPALRMRFQGEYDIELENGDVLSGRIPAQRRFREPLPLGYHTLRLRTTAGEASARILAAPRECWTGERAKSWGVFVPLYALRCTRDKPIGDVSDLSAIMQWTQQLGGNLVATLPISAAFLRVPHDPSPYSPASRLYWNELYADIDTLLAEGDCVLAATAYQEARDSANARRAAAQDIVDYESIAELKRAILERFAVCFFEARREDTTEFREFLQLYPDTHDYAQFRATGERQRSGWRAWPAAARDGQLVAADYDDVAYRYHIFAQFVMHRQLRGVAQLARSSGPHLYLDMPLGVHAESYDVWRLRDLFVTGASAGAPPDPFFTKGQNWGFPPLHPQHLRTTRGIDYWIRVLRTQLRYAGVLRLDHVMALHRLFFVPAGFDATQGVYVRYPTEELYAVLTIESTRQKSLIVGEDLGTVPAEVRRSMAEHAVKRMYVVQFEASAARRAPLGRVPRAAVASLNTHDMPPFASYWQAGDAELRREIGLLDERSTQQSKQDRLRTTRAISRFLRTNRYLRTSGRGTRTAREPATAAEALRALLVFLAESPADIVLVNLEDLWLEEEPQNVPGTAHERPNWRRRARYTLSEMAASPELIELLQLVNERRHKERKRGTNTR